MLYIIFCRWLDLNCGPLELEATALSTEPRPLPMECFYLNQQKSKDQSKAFAFIVKVFSKTFRIVKNNKIVMHGKMRNLVSEEFAPSVWKQFRSQSTYRGSKRVENRNFVHLECVFYIRIFNPLTLKNVLYKILLRLDSNLGSLVLEMPALPFAPQPLPLCWKKYSSRGNGCNTRGPGFKSNR